MDSGGGKIGQAAGLGHRKELPSCNLYRVHTPSLSAFLFTICKYYQTGVCCGLSQKSADPITACKLHHFTPDAHAAKPAGLQNDDFCFLARLVLRCGVWVWAYLQAATRPALPPKPVVQAPRL